MLVAFVALIPVFAVIALGFTLRKSGVIPAEHWRGVELISFWILFPALLINTLSGADLSISALTPFALAVLMMVVTICLFVWALRPWLSRHWQGNGPAFTSIFQTSTRWHGFIALAVVDKLFGAPGLAILAVAFVVMVPFLNVVNILVLATYAGKTRATLSMIARSLARNPMLWGVGLGFLVNITAVRLPGPLLATLDLLSRGALGVSLLALGAGLSWNAMKTSGREVFLSATLKLIVMPLLGALFAFLFQVQGNQFTIIIIAAAVPTAVNGYALARAMGGDAELYAAASTAQVLASFITLPLFVWSAQQLAG
ncbi:MAG TPA: AEC family transporter [Devosia sp.]|nr:AEC family transporter [Devosia sp.]